MSESTQYISFVDRSVERIMRGPTRTTVNTVVSIVKTDDVTKFVHVPSSSLHTQLPE